jgi:hypothetical protein
MEWVLKHQTDLQLLLTRHKYVVQNEGPWILHDTNYYHRASEYNDEEEETVQVDFPLEFSDNDDNIQNEGMVDARNGFICLLGFHPYKEEVVFLTHSLRRVLAYDLNNLSVEDLGNMYPRSYRSCPSYMACIRESFLYTPCWVEEFPLPT